MDKLAGSANEMSARSADQVSATSSYGYCAQSMPCHLRHLRPSWMRLCWMVSELSHVPSAKGACVGIPCIVWMFNRGVSMLLWAGHRKHCIVAFCCAVLLRASTHASLHQAGHAPRRRDTHACAQVVMFGGTAPALCHKRFLPCPISRPPLQPGVRTPARHGMLQHCAHTQGGSEPARACPTNPPRAACSVCTLPRHLQASVQAQPRPLPA